MPCFRFNLRQRSSTELDEVGMVFRDLHQAYLEACRAIPDTARDILAAGRDPMEAAYVICDDRGRRLLEVRFDEILSPAEWRLRQAKVLPRGVIRRERARDDQALKSFRQMFSSVNSGCVLMTPELMVTEMNDFGARHSHVDPDAIRGRSILDIFDHLNGEPKRHFAQFMRLAQTGAGSEVIDLPYLVLDQDGQSTMGWWNARVWPIYDDDDHLLGLVEWAEPSTRPSDGGLTKVCVTSRDL